MSEMFKNDSTLVFHALSMWANYIETGDVTMSAKDAERAKMEYKALTVDQMKLVIRLRELADYVLKNG